MLRGAEIAALRWEHVSIEAQGVVLLVESSKTDQAAQGQFVFLHDHADSGICPLRCLQRLAAMTPAGMLSGHIFTVHQHSLQPVQKATMLTRLHRRLQQLDAPSSLFGLHSLRSGGACICSTVAL